MKVAVRVDASRVIGTGHVRRMVSLGMALERAGAEVRFLWRDLGLDVGAMLPGPAWSLPSLPAPDDRKPLQAVGLHETWGGVSAAIDASQTIKHLAAFAPDWIVIDHYAFGLSWHKAVRGGTSARLAVIDDLADRPISADLIVDHNFHPSHEDKFADVNLAHARLLAGPAYAMLDDVYAEAPRYRFNAGIRSLGIFMGGVDAPNMSGIALAAIDRAGLDCAVEVATTRANPNLETLRQAIAHRPKTSLSMDLPDLAGFFARHDLQIGAGGGALWERFCIGAPTLAVICAENQRESVPYLAEIGAVRMADGLLPRSDAIDALASALSTLAAAPEQREAMSRLGQEMVDGRGTRRIAAVMQELGRGESA